jgi:hypothetical protein
MKTRFSIGILVLAGLLIGGPVSAATYDLSGTWQCTFSGAWASGDEGCVVGPNPSSTCTIEQTGDSFTLTLDAACNPAFTCVFSGSVIEATYTGMNSGPLEGGGTVENMIIFSASSMLDASGNGTSQATYPDWVCNWGFNSVVLSRGSVPGKYTLTANINGGGSVTLDPSGGVYDPGTSVTLTAEPDEGWQFDHWSEDADGSLNPDQIVMNEDKTVSATFTRTVKSSAGTLHLLLDD